MMECRDLGDVVLCREPMEELPPSSGWGRPVVFPLPYRPRVRVRGDGPGRALLLRAVPVSAMRRVWDQRRGPVPRQNQGVGRVSGLVDYLRARLDEKCPCPGYERPVWTPVEEDQP